MGERAFVHCHHFRLFSMNNLLKRFIKRSVLGGNANEEFSGFRMAKGFRAIRITAIRLLKDSFLMLLGVFSAAFGLESFLLPSGFIDGGATGISLLLAQTSGLPLGLFLILINVPFVVLGMNVVGKQFAVKTAVAIIGLAIVVSTVDFPTITEDKLLVSIFGGVFLGAGIGLSVRGGSVLDGTEVLAIFISRKLGSTLGDIVIMINVVIFSSAAYFLGIEIALYSMITYLSASRTLDFIIEGIEEYMGVTIISSHSDELRRMIIEDMRRGVTIYQGKRGFGKMGETTDVDIVYTVITRLELNKLNTEIEKIDPNAFVVMNSVKDTKGGMIKKRPLKH